MEIDRRRQSAFAETQDKKKHIFLARPGENRFILTLDQKKDDPIPDRIVDVLRRQPWVEDVIVRVRGRGRELTAEAHVVPTSDELSVADLSSAREQACKIDPRLAEVTIAPVSRMPDDIAKARQAEDA